MTLYDIVIILYIKSLSALVDATHFCKPSLRNKFPKSAGSMSQNIKKLPFGTIQILTLLVCGISFLHLSGKCL